MIAVDDARNDPRTRSFDRDYLSIENVHAMLDAPIFDGGRLSGVIWPVRIFWPASAGTSLPS